MSARALAGHLADGRAVEAIALSAGGYTARLFTYGATLQAYTTPDRAGRFDDIVLGFDTPREYEALAHPFIGATIGRYANRIAAGGFCLDGQRYPLDPAAPTLHSGASGFHAQLWTIEALGDDWAKLSHLSPDGAGGFPGAVAAHVTYALAPDGRLTIDLSATTTRPTVVAMTNHSFYNLAGQAGGQAMRLCIPASAFTPVRADMIPDGTLAPVAGTAFDFRQGRLLSEALAMRHPQLALCGGLDHNFALDKGATAQPGLAARLEHPASGRALDVYSTAPGLQVYSGVCFDGSLRGKGGLPYHTAQGLALEPQCFPDTPNQPGFGSARLDPGQVYRHRIELVPSLL